MILDPAPRVRAEELNYESFVLWNFLVMNRACKYVRMHNKIVEQGYAKSARARATVMLFIL